MTGIFIRIRDRIARLRIALQGGVDIAAPARVAYRNIHLKEGCTLRIGKGSIVSGRLFYERAGGEIRIGERTFIGDSVFACAEKMEIGSDVLIAWGCTVVDHDSHALDWKSRSRDVADWFEGRKDWSAVRTAPVRIADKAWLGFNVIVLKGVTIGEGAVVGAGSVVTRDVPPYTVVAGNPARVIREIPPHER